MFAVSSVRMQQWRLLLDGWILVRMDVQWLTHQGYCLAVVQPGSMTCLESVCIGPVLSRNTSGCQRPLVSIYS